MTNQVSVANVNPLDMGNDAHSVESAAAGFTEMLQEEDRPSSRSSRPRPSGQVKEEDDTLFPDTEDPGVAKDDDGQSTEDDHSDPILDDTEPKGDDDDEEEGEGDDTEEKDEGEDGDKDDEGEDGEIDPDREFEVTVDGETISVPFKELIAGYSREADYRQKTTALAEERQEVEEFAKVTVEERAKYATAIQEFISLATALQPRQEDLAALKESNPKLFIEISEQWDAIAKQIEKGKADLGEIAKRQAEDEARNYSEYVKSENAALLKAVPALANPKKAKDFREKIITYGKANGYTVEELTKGAVDHRDVLTLYKAARYDEIMASRKAGARPGKTEPKTSSTTRPRTVSKNTKPGTRRQLRDADRRLERSGSVDDAALAFTKMLEM